MFLSSIISLLKEEIYVKDRRIRGIKTDSRLLNKGDLFICINKGHNYIAEAIKKGVSAIIVEEDINFDTDVAIIKVKSTIKCLGIIAKYLRKQYHGIVIAITGSNGKTTTKEILSHLLSKNNKVLKSTDSCNNHIGIPNTLLNLSDDYDYVVLELGTNHFGEIKYLADIVNPDIAIITNIGNAHIGNFKRKKLILKEKMMIKKEKTVLFLNGEDKLLQKKDGIKVYNSDYPNYDFNYKLAFKVGEYLGYTFEQMENNLKDFHNLSSRMTYYKFNKVTIIDDAYNASLESFLLGLKAIKNYDRKIIVFGDMLELGKYSKRLHYKVYKEILKLDNVILLTIGKNTALLKNNLHFNSLEDIKEYFRNFLFLEGDVIYLKGSHKMQLFNLVEDLKIFANK